MDRCWTRVVVATVTLLSMAGMTYAGVGGGRAMEEGAPTFSIQARAGQIASLKGSVEETKRAYTDTPGALEDYGRFLETYDLEELGFTDNYAALGVFIEKRWKYFTFGFEGSYINPTAEGVARRIYAIGVDEVTYNGEEYEYMLIPDGRAYDGDIQGGMLQADLFFTPLHIDAGAVQVSPWLQGGIFSVVGRYEIDAGPAEGVTTYEYHDHEYVIGGKGEGVAGLAIPELGFGGEVVINLAERQHGNTQLVIDGTYSFLNFNGSTEDVGVSARNNKDVDLTYDSFNVGIQLEVPVSRTVDFLVGLSYRHLAADATIEAQDKSEEEQDAAREKYDKEVDFELDYWFAEIGFRF